MANPKRVLYYQLTQGPAHLARVRALDAQPGIECRGVQLASREKTRNYSLTAEDEPFVETVMEGVYEDLPLRSKVAAAKRHFDESGASAIIVDSPADPVQWYLGHRARRAGACAMTRWAATIADHPRKPWKEMLKRLVYRGWDHYLVTGQRGLEYLRMFDVANEHVTICGNPVRSAPIEAGRESVRRPRQESFLFVGRFLALKNLDRFLEAFLRYREEGGQWALRLAGTGEPEDVQRLKSRAKREPAIEFWGHLQFEELKTAYLFEGCLVLPSYSENWGLVVNEAMHAGMPILLSETCGCYPELLREGENGFGFDPRDDDAMVAALHSMERVSEEDRTAFGNRSVELIAPHTPEAWAIRVAEVVRKECS